MAYSQRSRVAGSASLILVLLLIVAVIGFWRGWFSFHGEQARQDIETAGQELKEQGQAVAAKISAATDLKTVTGHITDTAPAAQTLTVTDEDQQAWVFVINDKTEFSGDNDVKSLAAVNNGVKVSVVYNDDDTPRTAREVAILD